MHTPIPTLMQHYGTEDVFLSKTADAVPLLARLGMGILNFELASSNKKSGREAEIENTMRAEALRELELQRMQQATAPLRGQASGATPLDQGMTRLASIAAHTGADMAKEGGIGDFATMAKTFGSKAVGALKGLGGAGAAAAPAAGAGGGLMKFLGGGSGLKTNLALGGAVIGAGVLGSKALHAAGRSMGQQPYGGVAPTYGGSTARGMGVQLPYGVNQYGQPQVGTPL